MAFRRIHKIQVADSSTITIDISTGNDIYNVAALGGNRILSIINSTDTDSRLIIVKQDATGGRTLTFNGSALPINTTAGKTSVLSFFNNAGELLVIVSDTVSVNAASPYDTDAQSYFTASGLSNSTYKTAVNNFFISLKANTGLWSKRKAMWILWDTLNESKFNLFDPQDTDAAGRLTQTGTGAFAQGFTNTLGNTDGLYTKIKPSTINASGYLTRMVSVKTNLAGTKVDFGLLTTTAAPGSSDWLISRSTADQVWMRAGLNTSAADIKASVATGIGRLYGVTKSGGSVLYKDGQSLGTISFTVVNNSVNDFVIGNGGSSGSATVTGLPSERKISLAGLFLELTATEVGELDALISTLETALGR